MEAVLKQLESRIEEMVVAFNEAKAHETELKNRVQELENKVGAESDLVEQVASLEKQRDHLATRLQNVLNLIDETLAKEG